MLKFILIASIVLVSSCGATKEKKEQVESEVVETTETAETAADNVSEYNSNRPMREEDMIFIEGTVRVNSKGCPFYIEMVEGDLFSLVYPVNLEDKFKVDGKQIVFSYIPSRAQSIEGCEAQKVIAVSNVRAK